ncbi:MULTISPECIES: hydrogen peroxide-inducible genes activator [Pseudovibrio]|uniref:hydrogen peroxide-inducible genes activator n=1 Tax=Stappiaceae TaxID=2821832 RepID=UPI002365C3D2|nr:MULTISPECIES: hydrogen peroxide-inducible genes activator [Pseudovibrio]MDD7909427.1 hydrogen peroxide-inducible genes activator [Pseudovibrio exalbescens]MDX5594986.1 hydrogen peroxide-inducible genes activator [Pseudovibrio sp. SPO723]
MLPTLRQLQYFKALADHLSFSKAAEACHITQSTLSASIKQLEDILGCELVDRSGRALVLTEAGEHVLQRATELLRDAEDLVHGVQSDQEPLTGRFRLGVIPSIAPFLLPRFLPALRGRYPRLKLFLREDLTRNLISALREGRVDAALIAFPYNAEGFEQMVVGRDELILAVPGAHRLANAAVIDVDSIMNDTLLLLEDGHCLRDHALAATGGRLSVGGEDFQATSMTTLIQMIDNGLGLTLVPSLAAKAGVTLGTNLKLVRLNNETAYRDIGLIWRKKSAFDKNARVLGRAVEEFLSGEPLSAEEVM